MEILPDFSFINNLIQVRILVSFVSTFTPSSFARLFAAIDEGINLAGLTSYLAFGRRASSAISSASRSLSSMSIAFIPSISS